MNSAKVRTILYFLVKMFNIYVSKSNIFMHLPHFTVDSNSLIGRHNAMKYKGFPTSNDGMTSYFPFIFVEKHFIISEDRKCGGSKINNLPGWHKHEISNLTIKSSAYD